MEQTPESGIEEIPQRLDRWYTERSLVSLMCSAAWRLDWTTMAEVKSPKNSPEDELAWNGYVDLVIVHPQEGRLALEAKLVWVKNRASMKNIEWALDQACLDAKRLPDEYPAERRIGIAFVFADSTGDLAIEELCEQVRFEAKKHQAEFCTAVVRSDGSKYPGGFLIGRFAYPAG